VPDAELIASVVVALRAVEATTRHAAFLESGDGPAWAGIVTAEPLEELLVAVHDPVAALHVRFAERTPAALAHQFKTAPLRQVPLFDLLGTGRRYGRASAIASIFPRVTASYQRHQLMPGEGSCASCLVWRRRSCSSSRS
jgi:hypothetical protein